MTKPCNFPEKVNQRRIRALERMATRKTDTAKRHADVAAETETLKARIVASARDVKTKKYRGASR